jgi:hypothetical protein
MPRADRILGVLPACYRALEPGKLLGDLVRAAAAPIEEADTHLFRIQRSHRLLVAEQPEDVVRLAAALNLTAFHFEDLLADRRLDDEARLTAMRERAQRIARLHLHGLGTPRVVLEAAAIFLNARIPTDQPGAPTVKHVDPEGFVHRATLELGPSPEPRRADLHLYENPLRRKQHGPAARRPLDSWAVDNENLGPAPMTFLVQGVGERTVRPTLFSPEAAEGVVFNGIVPDGATLVVDAAGGARLDGRPVDDWLIHFRGGVFDFSDVETASHAVDSGGLASRPFLDDRAAPPARPVRSRGSLPAAPAGRSTWVLAVAEGGMDGSEFDAAVYASDPLPTGVFDADVAADACVYDLPPNAVAGLAWEERIPCAFKLVLPPRADLADDGDQEADVNYLGRVAGILPRFKPAGIRAYTDTARDTWVLGRSVIRGPDATDGEGIERNVTRVQGPLADGFVPLDRPQP